MSDPRRAILCRPQGRSAVVVLVALLAAVLGADSAGGASASPGVDWGPMAVLDDPDAVGDLDVGMDPGRLRVTERCVYLRARDGRRTTLAWRSGEEG